MPANPANKKKNIYLSGGLNGHPLHERREEFKKYEEKYKAANFGVINPLELDQGEHGDVDESGILRPNDEQWRSFMARDIGVILRSNVDALYMLPGWTHSRGARLEVLVAQYMGIPVHNAETGVVISSPKKEMKNA